MELNKSIAESGNPSTTDGFFLCVTLGVMNDDFSYIPDPDETPTRRLPLYGVEITLKVSQFLDTLNSNLKRYRVTVAGEIAGRINRRGAVTYFTIHDPEDEAALQCMAFNSVLDANAIVLAEGMAVKVNGHPEVWKRTGGFSFKAFQVQLTGEGDLKKQFELLVKKLEAEGLFSAEHKKQLPRFIKRIGLITAEGREAQTDFITHLAPCGLHIELVDSRMEGANAVREVCRAISWFNTHRTDIDVIVITRGGGSMESLQSFNNEEVARAIFASRIPVISAIGHERDVTIADYVADVRASTPTHAAKIISQDWLDGGLQLENYTATLARGMGGIISDWRESANRIAEHLTSDLHSRFETMHHDIALHMQSLAAVTAGTLKLTQSRLHGYTTALVHANPELKLRQGYSIVTDTAGAAIKDSKRIAVGQHVNLRFAMGSARASIDKIDKYTNK